MTDVLKLLLRVYVDIQQVTIHKTIILPQSQMQKRK